LLFRLIAITDLWEGIVRSEALWLEVAVLLAVGRNARSTVR
jgi:hypothetical protein